MTQNNQPSEPAGVILLPIGDFPQEVQQWMRRHSLPPAEIVRHLLTAAATGQWGAADRVLSDRRARALAAFLRGSILLEGLSTVSSAEIITGYRAYLGPAEPWPGARRVQRLLPPLMLFLFGLSRCNSVPRAGVAVRGWRGGRLLPLPPSPIQKMADSTGGAS